MTAEKFEGICDLTNESSIIRASRSCARPVMLVRGTVLNVLQTSNINIAENANDHV
jgi:hypothetical protein